MDNDSVDGFDDLFEPFGLEEGAPTDDPGPPQARQRDHTTGEQPEVPVGAVQCASCGTANHPGNRHCERCGARLAGGQMPVAPQPMMRTTAGARALIVLAAVVLAVALLALIVNVFSSGGGTGADESTSTSATSQTATPIAELTPIRVTCTSELTSFPCEALIDGNPETSWNATDGGIGVELNFLFSPPVQITEMIIQNVHDECRFLRNARMKGIEVLVDDLTQTTVEELADSQDPQRVQIRSLRTSSLSIRITSGYPGQSCDGNEPFSELAAEDIFFFGRPTPGDG